LHKKLLADFYDMSFKILEAKLWIKRLAMN
jgi:hypothetical protein